MPDKKHELYTGPIIDAHHHFWDLQRNYHPWLSESSVVPHRYGDYSIIKQTYLLPHFLEDIAGQNIVQSVYCESEWDYRDPLGETRYIHEMAPQYGYPGAMVAQAWLNSDDAPRLLAQQADYPLVRSVRHKPGGPTRPKDVGHGKYSLLLDDTWQCGYSVLAKYGLHFDLHSSWWNLPEAALLAKDFPQTTIIVNHTGLPGSREKQHLQGWHKAMSTLAKSPNVVVKISGLCEEGKEWTVEANRWIIEEVIAMFGAHRAMVGSNYPIDGIQVPYKRIFDGFRTILQSYSAETQRAVFHDTAQRIYRPLSSAALKK